MKPAQKTNTLENGCYFHAWITKRKNELRVFFNLSKPSVLPYRSYFFNFEFCVLGASVSLLLFRTTNIALTDNEICNLVSNEKKNAIAIKRSNAQISGGYY